MSHFFCTRSGPFPLGLLRTLSPAPSRPCIPAQGTTLGPGWVPAGVQGPSHQHPGVRSAPRCEVTTCPLLHWGWGQLGVEDCHLTTGITPLHIPLDPISLEDFSFAQESSLPLDLSRKEGSRASVPQLTLEHSAFCFQRSQPFASRSTGFQKHNVPTPFPQTRQTP